MKKNEAVFMFILAAVCLAFSIYGYAARKTGDKVIVTVDNEVYATLTLNKDTVFDINDTNTIEIKDGKVRMIEADCPDHLCIRQGEISDDSKSIVCLPNKVVVRIEKSENENENNQQ